MAQLALLKELLSKGFLVKLTAAGSPYLMLHYLKSFCVGSRLFS